MIFKKIMPPIWLLIAVLIMFNLHFLFPVIRFIPPFWTSLGYLLIVFGIALNLIGVQAFKQARTTIKPFETSSVLVTDGIFRFSRNPMYLGFVLVMMGIAVLLGSFSPFLVIIASLLLIDKAFVRVEEGMLAKGFGSKWEEYAAATRRWI